MAYLPVPPVHAPVPLSTPTSYTWSVLVSFANRNRTIQTSSTQSVDRKCSYTRTSDPGVIWWQLVIPQYQPPPAAASSTVLTVIAPAVFKPPPGFSLLLYLIGFIGLAPISSAHGGVQAYNSTLPRGPARAPGPGGVPFPETQERLSQLILYPSALYF